jgi:hypothetical protein
VYFPCANIARFLNIQISREDNDMLAEVANTSPTPDSALANELKAHNNALRCQRGLEEHHVRVTFIIKMVIELKHLQLLSTFHTTNGKIDTNSSYSNYFSISIASTSSCPSEEHLLAPFSLHVPLSVQKYYDTNQDQFYFAHLIMSHLTS